MSILKQNELQRLTVDEKVVDRLNEISNEITTLQNEEDDLRNQILEEMRSNNIDTCKSKNLVFTQVFPKDKLIFDSKKFLENESEDVIASFSTLNEHDDFNIEKFKAENPELYEKYVTHNVDLDVDTTKLQKALPIIFDKYASYIKNDKPSTLRITRKKGE